MRFFSRKQLFQFTHARQAFLEYVDDIIITIIISSIIIIIIIIIY